jgi:hypothetical protein
MEQKAAPMEHHPQEKPRSTSAMEFFRVPLERFNATPERATSTMHGERPLGHADVSSLPMSDAPSSPHAFEFDLDRGIRLQAVEKLETSPLLRLEKDVAPKTSGVYALYHKGVLVYIGKASKGTTKSKRTLRERLNEHVSKIGGRQNILVSEVESVLAT